MNKLWLIIKREYITRVRKWTFIIATILTPLGIGLYFLVSVLIMGYESGNQRIAVLDEGNILDKPLKTTDRAFFKKKNEWSFEEALVNFKEEAFDGVLHIPPIEDLKKIPSITYYSDQSLGIRTQQFINKQLEDRIKNARIAKSGLDKKTLKDLEADISIGLKSPNGEKEKDKTASTMVATGIGIFMGFVMYMTVFIYGMMVMRSVTEEKTTRIVEVMISSVKPFQLMMGKIIGVGAVGLTQITIWGILIPIMAFLVGLFFGPGDPDQFNDFSGSAAMDEEDMEIMMNLVVTELLALNWWYILPLFILFFLGGYFLYASLYAAVGSAMGDDLGEGQSLTIPITIPVIIAFVVMTVVVQNPHSDLAFWSSMFPLFSPIVMPARLAFQPPLWEIGLSLILLLVTAISFVWLSSRIYRVAILLYGKKISVRELGRWIFTSD